MRNQRTENTPQSPSPVAHKSLTPVFFRDAITKRTVSAQLDSAADLASLIKSIRQNLDLPHDDSRQIKTSLAGKSLKHGEALSAQGLRPYQTLLVETPALLGGMINGSTDGLDDNFKRMSNAAVEVEDRAPLAPPTGSSLNQDWAKNVASSQAELSNSEICKKFAERFNVKMLEMVASLPEDAMSALHEQLAQHQDWYDLLSDEQKKLVCGIFVSAFSQDDSAKSYFEDKNQYLMDILNSDRQLSLFVKLRCFTFGWQVAISATEDEKKGESYMSVEPIFGDDFAETFMESHMTHPYAKQLRPLTLDDEGIYYHMPEKYHNMKEFLNIVMPEETKSDMRPVVHKHLNPLQVLQLIFVLSPEKFDKYFVTEDSPTVQQLLVELVMSAKHENLFDLLVFAISTTKPKDDDQLLESLKTVFLQGSHQERQVMIDLTDSCQLQALWLRALTPAEVYEVIRARDSQAKFDLISNCSSKVVNQVIALLPKEEQKQLNDMMLLCVTGYPRKSFEELEVEMKSNYMATEPSTRKMLHTVSFPGKPNVLVCVEVAHSKDHFAKEDEKLDEIANISVSSKPLYDPESIQERLVEIEGEGDGASKLMKTVAPEGPYFQEMTMKLQSEKEKVPSESFRISYWEVCRDSKSLKYLDCSHSDELIQWKQGGQHVDRKVKQIFLFEGQNKEVFWFCKRTDDADDEKPFLDMYLLDEGMERPTKHEVPKESELYRVMIHGNDDIEEKTQIPNAVPTMIKDTTDTPMVVFKSVHFEKKVQACYYYDIQTKKEIARAQSATLFVKYLPKGEDRDSDKLSFLRLPYMSQSIASDKEELGDIMTNAMVSVMYVCKEGLPNWYTVNVDFSEARQSEALVELIDMENNDSEQVEEACKGQSRSSVAEKTKEFPHWGYAENDEFMNVLQICQHGAVQVKSCQQTNGLFTVNIMVFDPDADVNHDYFYECRSESEWHVQYFNSQFHCFPIEDEVTGTTSVMKINPRSGLIMSAPLSDPENDDYIVPWPVKESAKSYRWFTKPTLHEGHLIRTSIDNWGTLRVQQAQLPKKGAEKLESIDYFVDQATIPFVTDYPMMAHWHPWNRLMISHLSDLDQGAQVFEFDDVHFVCFLHHCEELSESRINFLAKDKKTGQACIILMRHDASFKQAQTRDLNKWSIQRVTLDSAFEKIFDDASNIKKAFLLNCVDETTLRAQIMQPAILYQTQTSIMLVQMQTVEIMTRNTSEIELSSIQIARGFNKYFYFVQLNLITRLEELQELKLTYEMQKFFPSQRTVFQNSTGSFTGMQIDNECAQKIDSFWTIGGSKDSLIPVIKNRLFLLDTELNKRVIEQGEENHYYDIVSSRNLSKVKGLKVAISNLLPHEFLTMTARCVVIKNSVYVDETGFNYNILDDDDVIILNSCMIQSTDKVLFNCRNTETSEASFVVKTHPGSRNTSLLGLRCRRDVISASQISTNKILFKMRKDCKEESYWTLMDIMGEIHPLTASLAKLLSSSEGLEAKSIKTNDGKFSLLLTGEEGQVSKSRFSLKGNLIATEKFSVDAPEDSILDETIQSKDGHIFRIFILADGQTDKPQVKSKQTKNSGSVTTIVFGTGRKDTDFLCVGNYLCWIEPDATEVYVLDTRPILKSDDASVSGALRLAFDLRKIDNESRMFGTQAHLISLDECSLNYAIHAQPSQDLTHAHLDAMSQHLQISIGNRGFIIDLALQSMPCIKEIIAMDKLLDCQKYVEPGFQVCYLTDQAGQESGEKYGVLSAIEASEATGVYVLRQQQIITKDAASNEKHTEDEKYSPFLGLYRTYNELSMLEARRLMDYRNTGITPKKIELQAIFSSFDGKTIFALTDGHIKIHKAILSVLEKQDFPDEEDEDETEIENQFLRRLRYLLNQKCYIDRNPDTNKINFKSVLVQNVTKPSERDVLLKTGGLSRQYNVMDDFFDDSIWKDLLKFGTSLSIEEMNKCFKFESSMNELTDFEWPKGLEFVTYRSNSCQLNEEELREVVKEKEDEDEGSLLKTVTAKVLNVGWMFKNCANFLQLAPMLKGQPDELYQTQFIKIIFEEFWDEEQERIIKWQLSPYLIYLVVSLLNFNLILKPRADEEAEEHDWLNYTAGVSNLLLWTYQFYQEAKQFWFNPDKIDHFKSLWNWFDLTGLVLTFCIVLTGLVDTKTLIDYSELRVIAAFASFCIMTKAFDWLRLFENTAFYILLVEETLKDIAAFMIILFASLLVFGLPIQYLNLNRTDDNAIVDGIFGFWGIDILFNQYLLALGEFNMDNFADNPQGLICYVFFILATFITQLTMLNMLIAIMGDTFGRVMEQKEVNATKTKLELMSDLSTIMSDSQIKDNDKTFLFVVQPDDAEEEAGNEWEGAINAAKNDTNKHIAALQEEIQKQIDTVREQQDLLKVSSDGLGSKLTQHISQIVRERNLNLERKIMAKLDAMNKPAEEAQ